MFVSFSIFTHLPGPLVSSRLSSPLELLCLNMEFTVVKLRPLFSVNSSKVLNCWLLILTTALTEEWWVLLLLQILSSMWVYVHGEPWPFEILDWLYDLSRSCWSLYLSISRVILLNNVQVSLDISCSSWCFLQWMWRILSLTIACCFSQYPLCSPGTNWCLDW